MCTRKLSLTYETEDIITPLTDQSMTPSISPDRINLCKKTEGYAAKVTQLPDEEQPEPVKPSDTSDVDENY